MRSDWSSTGDSESGALWQVDDTDSTDSNTAKSFRRHFLCWVVQHSCRANAFDTAIVSDRSGSLRPCWNIAESDRLSRVSPILTYLAAHRLMAPLNSKSKTIILSSFSIKRFQTLTYLTIDASFGTCDAWRDDKCEYQHLKHLLDHILCHCFHWSYRREWKNEKGKAKVWWKTLHWY